MIHLTPLRDLTLTAPSSAGRPAFLSAASGLVEIGPYLYVVADDELQLGIFPAQGNGPGELLQLRPGLLPDSYRQRKALKPDFETLVRLPPFTGYPDGALLAMGSGSTSHRNSGVLLALTADGRAFGIPLAIDLAGIYGPLAPRFHTLNIEGAVVIGDELVLMQRGNKHDGRCAYIRFCLPDVLSALASTNSLDATQPTEIRSYDLGAIGGAPLCFSDGAALPDGSIVFTAIAEAADDSYDDGPCNGAAIGITDSAGEVRFLERVDRDYKIEGVDARVDGRRIQLRLVTDADDAQVPARLLSGELDGYPF